MKTIILSVLLLFFIACNNPTETKNLSSDSTPKNFTADSMAIWTRNIKNNPTIIISDTINFTDANNLKQGKWVTFTGKEVKTEFYKDGELLEGC